MKLERGVKWIAKLTASLLVLVWLGFFSLDWSSLAQAIVLFPPYSIPVLLIPYALLRLAWAWHGMITFRSCALHVGFYEILRAQSVASFAGLVLPGDIAAGVISWKLLTNHGRDGYMTACILLAVRLTLLMALVPIALFVLSDANVTSKFPNIAQSCLVGLLACIAIYLLIPLNRRTQLIRTGDGNDSMNAKFFLNLFSAMSKALSIRRPQRFFVLIAGLASHLIVVLCVILAFGFYGIHLSFGLASLVVVTINLIQIVPFALSGLGVRELSVASLLESLVGIEQPMTIAIMVIIYASSVLVTLGFGIWAILTHAPTKPSNNVQQCSTS